MKQFLLAVLICWGIVVTGAVGGVDVLPTIYECTTQPRGEEPPVGSPPPTYYT